MVDSKIDTAFAGVVSQWRVKEVLWAAIDCLMPQLDVLTRNAQVEQMLSSFQLNLFVLSLIRTSRQQGAA